MGNISGQNQISDYIMGHSPEYASFYILYPLCSKLNLIWSITKKTNPTKKSIKKQAKLKTCLFVVSLLLTYLVQFQRLAPRGHKPILPERKERLSDRLVLCLSGLDKSLALSYLRPYFLLNRSTRPPASANF